MLLKVELYLGYSSVRLSMIFEQPSSWGFASNEYQDKRDL